MKELTLREIIRNRRMELDISQEALCEGLCSIGTFSRFENGGQDLSFKRVAALLERLGLPHERYYALLTEGEQALEEAEREARCASVCLGLAAEEERSAMWAVFREKLAALEALGPDDPFVRQCALSLRAVLGDENGPYSPDQRLSTLLDAIRLTVPRFDPEHVGLGPYSAEELRLVNQIAATYVLGEEYEEAVRIYRAALEYLEVNGQRLRQYSALRAYMSYNYSRVLCRMGRWQESRDMAQWGVQACRESARYHVLALLQWLQAECHFYLGNLEESISLYHGAHYVLKAAGNEYNLPLLDAEARERLDITFSY